MSFSIKKLSPPIPKPGSTLNNNTTFSGFSVNRNRYNSVPIPSTPSWALCPNPVGTPTTDLNWAYQDVAFGNGIWVTASNQVVEPRIMISSSPYAERFDISVNKTNVGNIQNTEFCNGRFFLSCSGVISYSSDGINWTDVSSGDISGYQWNSVTYIPSINRLVAVGTNVAAYSDNNGDSWTGVLSPNIPAGNYMKVVHDPSNNILVAVNGTAGVNQSIVSTNNGLTWSSAGSNLPSNVWWGLAYGNGYFICVSRSGGAVANQYARSTDGINWTASVLPSSLASTGYGTRGIAFGNGLWAICLTIFTSSMPSFGTGICISKDNGITWEIQRTPYTFNGRAQRWNGISYGNNRFVTCAERSGGPFNMVGYPATSNSIGLLNNPSIL